MLRGLRSNNPLLVKGVTDVPFGPVSKRLLAQEPYKTWYRIDCVSIFQLVVGWGVHWRGIDTLSFYLHARNH